MVIGKADSMTPDECQEFKQMLLDQLEQNKIQLYDFPESVFSMDDFEEPSMPADIRRARQRQPFAVVSSDKLVNLPDGKKVRIFCWVEV